MARILPLNGSSDDRGTQFQIRLQYANWLKLFANELFLPIFKLRIKNFGSVLNGQVQISIAKFENIEELVSVGTFQGPFVDVFSCEIDNLKKQKTKTIKFKIESRYLSEGKYIIRIRLFEKQPAGKILTEKDQMVISFSGSRDSFGLRQISDFKTLEVIKIHAWEKVLAAYAGIITLLIAVLTYILK